MIERRAIDPSPDALRAMVAGAVAAVFPDRPAPADGWREIVERGLETPQGGGSVDLLTAGEWVDLDLGWWTDRLGRKHWHARAVASHDEQVRPPAPPYTDPVCWAAPWAAAGQRSREGRRETVVICRCGVVGTPESVAWAGDRCGPCFDREQDGEPSGLPPATRTPPTGRQLHVLRDGRFLESEGSPQAGSVVRLWKSPDDAAPAWEATSQGTFFADGGRFLATFSLAGHVTVHGIEDGAVLGAWDTRIGQVRITGQILWVQADSGWWLIVLGWQGGVLVSVGLQVSSSGQILRLGWSRRIGGRGNPLLLDGQHGGHFLLACRDHVERCEAMTGKVLELLVPPKYRSLRAGSVVGDEALVALSNPSAVGRWRLSERAVSGGIWGWLSGPPKRTPNLDVTVEHEPRGVIPAPGGELASLEQGGLAARCARTLRLRALFQPPEGLVRGPLAFTPDGRLLVGIGNGLAVWPWRELMGGP